MKIQSNHLMLILHELANWLCLKRSICESQKKNSYWIPRTNNDDADQLSRVTDHDDLGVRQFIYIFLNELWDKCTIDRFASHEMKHHEIFNSNVWYPGTEHSCNLNLF
jgi:hypothetical protein